ncbi:glycosyltransferase family 4 protein [Metabacillus niabensis]|uniref:Glycosyltransferase involved in cell wall biosynthesis n=1 Tax=Metabacillus niabensis TaxID=324854 RepID=A0ABT9Z4H5_9BACI|nr:glycosyltransferase family 4 protein [Metabacillus niabensis]MDQ0227156.1 glycosyltransferase involved in cell wall biosynthesis [Metabacillus niabensis]
MTKICVLTTVHQAYDGRIYHKQCKSLKKAGYDVTLLAPKPDKMIKDDGINLIPIEKPKNELKRFLHAFKVFKLAKETKADLYHFHDPELIPVGVLLRIFTRKPVIFDVHEHYPNAIMSKKYLKSWLKRPIRLAYEIIEKLSLPILSGVIYTTEEIGKRYKSYTSCKIENYPLTDMFPPLQKVKGDHHTLLYLGGITRIRGIEELIDGFAKVAIERPEAKLLFVGGFESDSFEREIKQKVKEHHLEEKVQFKGKVPYEQIEGYLSTASIGIIPYLPVPNHLVCLPNKLFEYMAAGVAVISSDFPHYRKVVESSSSGLLIDPESPQSIAKAMISLLDDATLTDEMGQNGRVAFETKYNWNSEEEKLVAFYRKILTK